MEIIKTIAEMQEKSRSLIKNGKSIAFVPTMGYFHDGHTSLINLASDYADVVVTSLFVNPTQFAPNEDFAKYPRDFNRDCTIAENAGSDILFNPDVGEMYPSNYFTSVVVAEISEKFEGKFRPTHFTGVATVVTKLLNIVNPDFAIFGQKDYQQLLIVKKLVRDLNINTKIITAPTKRQSDGLAMSSRNVYLSQGERNNASILYLAMENAIKIIENGENRRKIINATMHNTLRSVPDIKIDYASAAEADTLAEPEFFLPGTRLVLLLAVYLGKTRLIDNSIVSLPEQKFEKPEWVKEVL